MILIDCRRCERRPQSALRAHDLPHLARQRSHDVRTTPRNGSLCTHCAQRLRLGYVCVWCRFREIPEPIVDPATGLSMRKEVYTVMFMGTQLKQRIMRTTTAFAASRYSVPADSKEQKAKLDELRVRLRLPRCSQ